MRSLSELDDKGEWYKLVLANVVGGVMIVILAIIGRWITPVGDPTILSWLIIKKAIVLILAILGTVDAASLINFITEGSWWSELIENKNMAVAVACAGLFVGIGLSISGAV